MADQFDVHPKPGVKNPAMPFVLIVQSNRFRASSQRVVIPLMDANSFRFPESDVAPHFRVQRREVVLDPLRITNVPLRVLGDAIASLADDAARIIGALDTLLSRAWR